MEMLTYPVSECGKKPIYRYIYECIKYDILSGTIPSGEKLPSKRSLASNLEVAVITIENAYSMLEAEGYIYTVEKKGYFVSDDMKVILPEMIPTAESAPSKAEVSGHLNMPSAAAVRTSGGGSVRSAARGRAALAPDSGYG